MIFGRFTALRGKHILCSPLLYKQNHLLHKNNIAPLPRLALSTKSNHLLAFKDVAAISTTASKTTNNDNGISWNKIGMIAGAASLLSLDNWLTEKEKAKCCGIAGIVGRQGTDAR